MSLWQKSSPRPLLVAVALLLAFQDDQAFGRQTDDTADSALVDVVNAAEKPSQLQYCAKISDDIAEAILKYRDSKKGGYKSSDELEADLLMIDPTGDTLKKLCACYACCGVNPNAVGQWNTLPYETLRPDGSQWPTAHATMLPTGKVLLFPSSTPPRCCSGTRQTK